MKRIAVITGGTGCIGYNLILKLLQEGDWEIIALHRQTSDLSVFKPILSQVELREVDLYDYQSVREVISSATTVIFHCAGNVDHRPNPNQWNDNVLTTRNLAERALEVSARMVFVSTGATLPYQAITNPRVLARIKVPYVRTKRLGELELMKVVENGLDGIIVQPIIVIGQYDFHRNYSMFFLQKDLRFPVFPGKVEFCDVEDIVTGIVQAFERGVRGEHYVLGGQYLSWIEFLTIVAKTTSAIPPVQVTPLWLLKFLAYIQVGWHKLGGKTPDLTPALIDLICNGEPVTVNHFLRSKNALGYQATMDIQPACKKLHDWLQQQNN